MNSRVAGQLRRPAGLRVLKFPFESPKMNYGLYWHGRQTADPAHTWLREVIIEAAKDRRR
jgi:DNA-binding transcriptional LysR family regulator